MANAKQTKTSIDPQELHNAQQTWQAFTDFTKWGIISIVALLVLMAATLL